MNGVYLFMIFLFPDNKISQKNSKNILYKLAYNAVIRLYIASKYISRILMSIIGNTLNSTVISYKITSKNLDKITIPNTKKSRTTAEKAISETEK